jgi:HPt (histidine-containing phosphotransfer) domain-containing protein
MAAMPVLPFSLQKEFALDYVDRNLYGPVLSPNDEFLDTLQLRTALGKALDQPLADTPYRLVVRLIARDNRRQAESAAHQEGKSAEAFEFNVVSEQDLLIEGGKREEDLRDRFDEAITQLRKLRSGLKRIRDELGSEVKPRDEDVRRGMNDAQDATKALAAIRIALDEKVLREFRQIYREFALNRVDERVLDRINGRICLPLAILLQPEQLYAKLEQSVDTLARRLETEGASLPPSLLDQPVVAADRVLQKLDEILNDMRKLIEFNEALRVLRDLINNEQKLLEEMKKLIEQKLKNDLDDK